MVNALHTILARLTWVFSYVRHRGCRHRHRYSIALSGPRHVSACIHPNPTQWRRMSSSICFSSSSHSSRSSLVLFLLSSESMWICLSLPKPFNESLILHANTQHIDHSTDLVKAHTPRLLLFSDQYHRHTTYNTHIHRTNIVTSISLRKYRRPNAFVCLTTHSWHTKFFGKILSVCT